MKTIIHLAVGLLLSFCAHSQSFEFKGVKYNIISRVDMEVETVSIVDKEIKKIKLPAKVKYEETSYIVKSIGDHTFRNCTELENIQLPSKVTTIKSYAFENCTSLETITLPNSVDSIDHFVFKNSDALHTIILGQSLSYFNPTAFHNCEKLKNIYVTPKNENFTSYDGILYSKDKKHLMKYAEGRTKRSFKIPDHVYWIESNAFSNNKFLTVVTVGEELITTGISSFAYCPNLYLVHFNDKIRVIGSGTFHECTNLEIVILPSSITKIGSRSFADCESLDSITLCSHFPPLLGDSVFARTNKNLRIHVRPESILRYKLTQDWRNKPTRSCNTCCRSDDLIYEYKAEGNHTTVSGHQWDIPYDAIPFVQHKPKTNQFYVFLPEKYKTATFQLFDSKGILTISTSINESTYIDTGRLKYGDYFYKLNYGYRKPIIKGRINI